MKRLTYILVSSKVDALIQEQVPDATIVLFRSVQELVEYIETKPLRADSMFVTQDVLGNNPNSRINVLFQSLGNIFLKVEKVEYITEVGSPEIPSLEFIIEDKEVTNWEIHQIESLTREKITGMITGTLKSDDVAPKLKAVYRQRRDEFIKESMNKTGSDMSNPFLSEEELLEDIPDVPNNEPLPSEVPLIGQTRIITGLNTVDRTMFALIYAQYLSFTEKTLICESDFEYLRLTDLAHKMHIQHLAIDVTELYINTMETLNKIRNTSRKLIIITCKTRSAYKYEFVTTLLFANLKDSVAYFVKESELHEVSESNKYIVCMNNNVIDIIKTCEGLPNNYSENAVFVAVDTTRVQETSIPNSEALGHIVSELLQIPAPYIPIYKITSLRGGNTAGLRMLT